MGKKEGKRRGKYSAHRGRSNFVRWLPNEWRKREKKVFFTRMHKRENGRGRHPRFLPPPFPRNFPAAAISSLLASFPKISLEEMVLT